MNILFIGKRRLDAGSGIEKKMMGQIHAFENLGHLVKYTYFDNGTVYLADTKGNIEPLTTYKNNTVSLYLANERAIKISLKKYPYFFQMFYMRKGMCSSLHLKNLQRLKKNKIKILEEIPTFPYDRELITMKGLGLKVFLVFDNIFRIFLKKYVDFIVTYSEDSQIFGIPTVCINNGIELNGIPLRKYEDTGKPVRILTVSTMYFWHGYDRLIKGLAEYYATHTNEDVHLDMVGDGVCRKEWEELAVSLGVQKHITFHGMLSGEKLDQIYDTCDIAAASLAPFRKGMVKASELKIREYCARGIPFILANTDLGLNNEFFYYSVSNDNSNIDIDKMVQFARNFSKDVENIDKMREFALKNLSWEIQIKKIMDRVNEA